MNLIRTVSAIFLAGTMMAGPVVLPEVAQAREKREFLSEFFSKAKKKNAQRKATRQQKAKKQRSVSTKRVVKTTKRKRKSVAEVLHQGRSEASAKRRSKALAARTLKNNNRQSTPRKLAKKPARATAPRVLPKIETSKYFDYVVAKRTAISIKPKEMVYAVATQAAPSGSPVLSDGATESGVKPVASLMTRDLHLAGNKSWNAEKHLASALSDHYTQVQDYVWVNENGGWNARARSVQKLMAKSGLYGLSAEDYKIDVPALDIQADDKTRAAHRLSMEMEMSVAALRYSMDAKYGRINPNRLSGYHDFPKRSENAPQVMADLFGPGLPANTMASLHPGNVKFVALQDELLKLSESETDSVKVPTNVIIKAGRQHEALPLFVQAIEARGSEGLREAHSEALANYSGSIVYSKELVELVRAYQKEAGLSADGIIGPNTARKLVGQTSHSKRERIVLAMERLRWHPHTFGERHVFINQPEYRARYVVNGKEELSMRVVVGKKSNQTNFFYDEIEHVEFNPYWNVPRSIVVNEFLPKSLSNPGYLDKKGYEVSKVWNGTKISSRQINWSQVNEKPKFFVRQPPGPSNALGQLKIMFPNDHAIYMHDTPAKDLFSRDSRAFSHGCVRLHDPQAMAAAVLGKNRHHVNAAISTGENHTERLQQNVPIYVSYFTAWPQQDGTVHYFDDMYERDVHLQKAISITTKARQQPIGS